MERGNPFQLDRRNSYNNILNYVQKTVTLYMDMNEENTSEDLMKQMEKEDYDLFLKYVDLDQIYLFCKENKVEVLVQDDGQYHCYINYVTGDGAWEIGMHPLTTLVFGIKSYLEHNDSTSN